MPHEVLDDVLLLTDENDLAADEPNCFRGSELFRKAPVSYGCSANPPQDFPLSDLNYVSADSTK